MNGLIWREYSTGWGATNSEGWQVIGVQSPQQSNTGEWAVSYRKTQSYAVERVYLPADLSLDEVREIATTIWSCHERTRVDARKA